ncbi:MAG: hypothetical protein LBF74_05925 [Treponema sp.]|jgi:hypothetical protein|nr:hypothetical protein [Treponema sp.]
MDELNRLLKESFEYNMANIHTSFPGKVVRYDPKTRRADIQPSLKRRLPDGSFADFPEIPDVPVLFTGTSKYTIHIPLEKGDEVEVRVCERSTDIWRDSGDQGIEDTDPRRFNLQDCYASPGLQPVHFIPATENGLQILHHDAFDGNFISQVLMDDNKIEAKYKAKSTALMEDDHVRAYTEKCSVDMTKGNIQAKNGKDEITMMDGDVDIKSPTPIGIKGTETILGNGVLQPYWKAETNAWKQWPMFIPPVPWPAGMPVPPAPPIICMALNGLRDAIAAADAAAQANGAKSIK